MKVLLLAMFGGLLTPAAQDKSSNTVEQFEAPVVVEQRSESRAEVFPLVPSKDNNTNRTSTYDSHPIENTTVPTNDSYRLREVESVVGCTSSSCSKPGCNGCCEESCNRCGGHGCNYCCQKYRKRLRVKSSCNMPVHFAYFPDCHGYYYFHPYHHDHIAHHIGLISIVGGDKRAPYSTEYFAKFYTDVLGVEAKRPQKLPNLGPTSDDANELPDLEELLKR